MPLQAAVAAIRAGVPPLAQDRYLAPEIEAAADLVRRDALAEAAGLALTP